MPPSSYQAPTRADKSDKAETKSQTIDSNLSHGNSTVAMLLAGKGESICAVRPSDTVHDVVKLLKEKSIGAVVVTDQSGALLGILSERDIVRRMADTPGQTLPQLVENLMTRDVQTCTPDDLLVDLLRWMTKGRFRHMPVRRGTQLCGMVSIGDVVQFRLKELEYEALKMRQMIVG
ncbi:MAG: CBS domain-containing protein [Burkholderiaceae bacterium]